MDPNALLLDALLHNPSLLDDTAWPGPMDPAAMAAHALALDPWCSVALEPIPPSMGDFTSGRNADEDELVWLLSNGGREASSATMAERPAKRLRSLLPAPEGPVDSAHRRYGEDDVASLRSESTTIAESPAEDRRRRNTQASARFRKKKKDELLHLRAEVESLRARSETAEERLKMLEMERTWMRGLLLEKDPRVVALVNRLLLK